MFDVRPRQVRIPGELDDMLKQTALEAGVSVNAYIVNLIRAAVTREGESVIITEYLAYLPKIDTSPLDRALEATRPAVERVEKIEKIAQQARSAVQVPCLHLRKVGKLGNRHCADCGVAL